MSELGVQFFRIDNRVVGKLDNSVLAAGLCGIDQFLEILNLDFRSVLERNDEFLAGCQVHFGNAVLWKRHCIYMAWIQLHRKVKYLVCVAGFYGCRIFWHR